MTSQSSKSRAHRGVTLIECLVASLLLALGASGVMVAMSASLQQQKYAQEERTASLLAVQLLEEVSARAYIDPDDPDYATRSLSGAQSMNGYADTVDTKGHATADPWGYSRTVQVGPAQSSGLSAMVGAGLATVEVTTPSGNVVQMRQILPAR